MAHQSSWKICSRNCPVLCHSARTDPSGTIHRYVAGSLSGRSGELHDLAYPRWRSRAVPVPPGTGRTDSCRESHEFRACPREEIGWRGWLWSRLQAYGQLISIVISGGIWGIWHAPLILLGYNYPFATGPWGVMAMCGMCIVFGAFLGWLRNFSDSVWPAALAHGVFNASVGLVSLFIVMGAPLDTTQASILGWSGWLLPTLVIAVMLLCGAYNLKRTTNLSTIR
ncbi:CPBP family intramembrane metalloprotease [Glutamicibacter arilaitensis]|uniref:CPBP family intramembrane metalloprotease n=1 Tax=Glutamicibacter arilaitensis TaxID=256701 RepID=A0A4Y8U291_9MICC|nr:CPBP family intramembrane metalloprotease [Glutamicibacter arilaitensis]